jgi:hypothetical protein
MVIRDELQGIGNALDKIVLADKGHLACRSFIDVVCKAVNGC